MEHTHTHTRGLGMMEDDGTEHDPGEVVCPITQCAISDPVIDKCEPCVHTFEREAILGWLRVPHFTCPVSRHPLCPTDLTPVRNWKPAGYQALWPRNPSSEWRWWWHNREYRRMPAEFFLQHHQTCWTRQAYPEALWALGVWCELTGESKFDTQAVDFYSQATHRGHPKAQHDLARCCYLGIGMKPSFHQALGWWRRAADNPEAMLSLFYFTGDRQKLQQAADCGLPEACWAVAICALVPKHPYRSHWHPTALQWMTQASEAIPANKWPTEALNWMKRAAEGGWPAAMTRLAWWYLQVSSSSAQQQQQQLVQREEAERWLTCAARDHGDAVALDTLGSLVWATNPTFSAWCWSVAGRRGCAKSNRRLSELFGSPRRYGSVVLVGHDFQLKSAEWVHRAAKTGDCEAMGAVAEWCLEGSMGFAQCRNTAAAWRLRAAENNHPESQFIVAQWLEIGAHGFPCDQERALGFYTRAAEAGHGGAIAILALHCDPIIPSLAQSVQMC